MLPESLKTTTIRNELLGVYHIRRDERNVDSMKGLVRGFIFQLSKEEEKRYNRNLSNPEWCGYLQQSQESKNRGPTAGHLAGFV